MADSKLHLFVDNSNVKIEGGRLAYAKRQNGGKRCQHVDASYEIDWGKFLHLVKSQGNRVLAQVPILYGSRPPPDDSVWEEIRSEGFDVRLFDRNIRNKEKGVDMELGMDVVERLFNVQAPATIVIVAGDGDYTGVVDRAVRRDWAVEVWYWGNAATEMRRHAPTFVDLDPAFDYLRKGGGVMFPPVL